MRIHKPVRGDDAVDPDRTLDIERGAVTFDPWPFGEGVHVSLPNSRFLNWRLAFSGPDSYNLYETCNTLAYTLSGIPVVMSEASWLEASS